MLRLVIPKGSLENQTLALFEAADIRLLRGSDRDYHGTVDDPRLDRFSLLRPQEIPNYVEEGFFDVGLTGLDWVRETGADVETIAELAYSKGNVGERGIVKIVLAVSDSTDITSVEQMPPGSKISTEYPNLTRKLFEDLDIPVKIFMSYGATEAKVPEIVDAIVDVTETGSTLRKNRLRIIHTMLKSPTLLIANKQSWADPEKRRALEELKILIFGAVDARGKVLVKLNVSRDDLEQVLDVIPALGSPTVSQLARGSGYAIESVVEKKEINVLIPTLKAKGATDILELPITKIVD
ncbi:MAG TPA: ATP phosphoribosyltransferase [Actinomycetota bacterium]|nr:ATP phosphoribosyltransferase [Actinomycetota bacterium]